MTTDRTTPRFEVEGGRAVLGGSEFLTARESALQACIEELERELAAMEGTPDDVESLEQQATDGLRAVADLLYPPGAPAQAQAPPPVAKGPMPSPARPPVPATGDRRVRLVAGVLLALAAVAVILMVQGLPLLGGTRIDSTAVPSSSAPATAAVPPGVVVGATRTRSEPTAAPVASATASAPIVLELSVERDRETAAKAVQIVGISDTLRLDLSLMVMTETVELVGGVPVLELAPPKHGAGVHRGSVAFGEAGATVIAVPNGEATDDLWQTRPGERLAGCNDDGACYDYQVVAAESWPLDRVRRFVDASPADEGVWLYAVRDTDAWVVQARLQREER